MGYHAAVVAIRRWPRPASPRSPLGRLLHDQDSASISRSISAISESVKIGRLGLSAAWLGAPSPARRTSRPSRLIPPVSACLASPEVGQEGGLCSRPVSAFLEPVDQLPEFLGRQGSRLAPLGRQSDAAIRRNDGQGLGIGVFGDQLLDPGIGVLVSESEDDVKPSIGRERAGSRPEATWRRRRLSSRAATVFPSATASSSRNRRRARRNPSRPSFGPVFGPSRPPACITL